MQAITTFIHSQDFWYYHGWVLTILWVIVSVVAIVLKSYYTVLHVISFAIVDFTTLFFAGSALYQIYPKFSEFWTWDTVRQGHIAGGSIFLVCIIMQHLGGVMAFMKNKSNPVHRTLGRPFATIARIIVCFGWILGGNMDMATYVAIAACIILLSHFIFKESNLQVRKRE